MQLHRMRYRKAIKDKDHGIILEVTNALHESLVQKDSNSFWKTWKNQFGSGKGKISIEGLTDVQIIADGFADFFQNACSTNSVEKDIEIDRQFHVCY